MAVNFHENAPSFHLKHKRKIKQWIEESIGKEHYITGDINFVFETDEKVYLANKKYLKHDWYTDVISFEYNEKRKIHGDILISIDRVKENALKFNVPLEEETRRVMIHGVLHLCGYDDGTQREKRNMHKLEDSYLRLWEMMKGES